MAKAQARRFAATTTVPAEKTRIEIDNLLQRHGGAQRLIALDDAAGRAIVQFMLEGRIVKMDVLLYRCQLNPKTAYWHESRQKECPPRWNSWSMQQRQNYIEETNAQHARTAWRRLLLVLKGKLELIADELSTVEREFLADILLPNGTTVGKALAPQLQQAYQDGKVPPLLGSAE